MRSETLAAGFSTSERGGGTRVLLRSLFAPYPRALIRTSPILELNEHILSSDDAKRNVAPRVRGERRPSLFKSRERKGAAAADDDDDRLATSLALARRAPWTLFPFSPLSFPLFFSPACPETPPPLTTPLDHEKPKAPRLPAAPRPSLAPTRPSLAAEATSLQFIKGVIEPSVPDVSLTRSRDGSSGVATFVFTSPSIFDASSDVGDITGLYLVDDEGTLSTVDVSAKFVNGKPDRIEAKYFMRSEFEWNRFLRFMERYAEDNELGFAKKQQDE